MISLYDYQSQGVDQVAINFSQGIRRQVFQLPTGGGKTVVFSGMVQRFISSFNKNVLILVHREELLKQTRKTLYNGFNIFSEPVVAGKKHKASKVYVGMVETAYNRIKKNPHCFGKVGMLIVDECHIGNFKKIYDYFEDSLIVGFSATPISSSKKDPLRNYYDQIVTGPQIIEIIQRAKLSANETYSIKGINRKKLKVKRGEYDSRDMGNEFSKTKNVFNVVEAYKRIGNGQKSIVFNCNVEHSKLVNDAFIESGYPSRHLDGTSKDRAATLQWFKETPNAILNNIGVLTAGFDEPSIINVIVNRSTKSLPLWLQMTGRGARIYPGKDFFRIIDMGGNAIEHGDWRDDRNWHAIFHYPEKAGESSGVAPIKSCDGCDAIIPAQTRVCKLCGHVHERIVEYDTIAPEFELLVSRINVQKQIQETNEAGHKEWKTFFDVLQKTVTTLKYRMGDLHLTDEVKEHTFLQFEKKVKEWRKYIKKPYSRRVKDFAREQFMSALSKIELAA